MGINNDFSLWMDGIDIGIITKYVNKYVNLLDNAIH